MLSNLKHFIVISLTISVIRAEESGNNDSLQNNLDYISHEGNSCDVKLSAALSLLKAEMLQNNRRVDELWKTKHDLDDGIDGKFHKLEKNILDKLEEYIEGKLDSMEKHMHRKIDALEKNIPDKTDIAILSRKFDGLNKMQTNFDETTVSESITTHTVNETLRRMHEEMNNKLLQHFDENVNIKLKTIETQILNISKNKSCDWGMHDILNKIQKNITDQNKNISDASENTTKKKKLPNRTHGYWECKNRTVNNIQDFELTRMDSDTFNYFTLKSDEGGLTQFEMRFAAKGTLVHIQLSMIPHPGVGEGYFIIQIDKTYSYALIGRRTDADTGVTNSILKRFDSPTGLVKDRYTAYYFKLTNQTLEVGKEGSNTPLIKYTDARFRTVQYIGFTSWSTHESSYLYDCPPHFEETIF